DGQSEYAGSEDVDPRSVAEIEDLAGLGSGDQHQQRDHQREDDLLAVAEQQLRLHQRLRTNHSIQRCAARTGCEIERRGHRSSLPVNSRNTSSKVRRSTVRRSAITPLEAHHAVRVASSDGSTSPVRTYAPGVFSTTFEALGSASANSPTSRPGRALNRIVFSAPSDVSCVGVPLAMTRPWSTTCTWSARRSASSM